LKQLIFVFDESNDCSLSSQRISSKNQETIDLAGPPTGAHKGHSLEGFHSSVVVPSPGARPWKQYLAFAGPAFLVSVGYMDPGNWATDLQAGAQFKYQLLWIVGLSSLMAIFLQIISARLGI
jgi:manganese transport protein